MFGELNELEIENVLMRQLVGRIGCHADDITYVVPVSYAYDGECIYGLARDGMKINMMRKNRTVCFEVDDMQNMANWQSVIAWGEFEELTEETQRGRAIQHLHDRVLPMIASATTKLTSDWPFGLTDTNSVKGVVYRIRLLKKSGRFENNEVPSFMSYG